MLLRYLTQPCSGRTEKTPIGRKRLDLTLLREEAFGEKGKGNLEAVTQYGRRGYRGSREGGKRPGVRERSCARRLLEKKIKPR